MKTIKLFIFSLFTSWRSTLILLSIYALLLGVATFIESHFGTVVARTYIYNNLLFYWLQLILIGNFIGISLFYKLWQQRRYGLLLMHLSLAVILSGALFTHLFGFEGIMHIREGETVAVMHSADEAFDLPFSVRLDKFDLIRYPGSHSPSSFESSLTLFSVNGKRTEHIYMNKVIYEQGYRIYQSSYDTDEQGTVLTVNNDAVGTGITYTGYILLLAGIFATLVDPKSRFRQLNKRLKQMTAIFLIVLASSINVHAQNQETLQLLKNTIPATQAEYWGRLQVQCPTGRIEPVNTYTSKLLRKIYRNDRFEDLSSEQVIIGFLINPAYWSNIPLIRQTNKELQHKYSLPEETYIRFSDFFDTDGNYRLAIPVEKAYACPVAERSRLEKDLLKLDEKVNIIYSLQQGKMLSLFPLPDDKSGKWYAAGDDLSRFAGQDSIFVSKIFPWYLNEANEAMRSGNWNTASEVLRMIDIYQQKRSTETLLSERQVYWELFYNKAQLFFWSAVSYMATGFILLLFLILQLIGHSKRWNPFVRGLLGLVLLVFVMHTSGIGIRWFISGRAPWANAYESMIYVAWATALAGILFIKRSAMTLALAALFAGIILFVANLHFMDPEITPLVPVLKSYWLMIHVAVITASYGFFGISFLLGTLSLVFMAVCSEKRAILLREKISELRVINEMSLHIGLYLLTAGIFLGAIWANESWGRYWGWDPKETWALVTMIVYTIILHTRFVPVLSSDYAFSVMSVLGLTSVLMTYFGVNYYLSGLHSYGNNDIPLALNIVIIIYGLLLWLIAYTWRLRLKSRYS